jgi:hypothetical protein
VDAETEAGEAEVLDRFLFFSSAMRLFISVLETVIIERIASVKRVNSGLSGGVFMALS